MHDTDQFHDFSSYSWKHASKQKEICWQQRQQKLETCSVRVKGIYSYNQAPAPVTMLQTMTYCPWESFRGPCAIFMLLVGYSIHLLTFQNCSKKYNHSSSFVGSNMDNWTFLFVEEYRYVFLDFCNSQFVTGDYSYNCVGTIGDMIC